MNSHDKLALLKARMNRAHKDAPPPVWISKSERILIAFGLLALFLAGLGTAWFLLVVLR